MASRWVRLGDGTELHYRISIGPPPLAMPIVLVHGLVASSRYLVPLGEHLAPWFRVYAPDLPGFGLSAKPTETLDIAALAEALAAWMAATRIERAHLIGNSLGCNVLAELATRHPGRVARLVLQGPTTDPRARSMPALIGRWLVNSEREPPSPGIMIEDYRAAGLGRAYRTLRYLLQHRIEAVLPAVRAPTLVLRGARDPIVPHDWAQRAADLLPDGRLIEIPGTAHTINLYAPLEFARVTRPFLGAAARPAAESRAA